MTRTPARLALLAIALAAPASADEPTRGQTAFFESKVCPVFIERCYGCHGAAAKKLKGGLRLDTADGVRLGGEGGTALVPGDPNASLLVKEVRRAGGAPRMPPDAPLPPAEMVQWDQHSDLKKRHAKNAREVDEPIEGLLTDLKSRGLLQDTLVLWGGEFGRTPTGGTRPRIRSTSTTCTRRSCTCSAWTTSG